MIDLVDVICVIVGILLYFVGLPFLARTLRRRRNKSDSFSDDGITIETDCRACGQFNRVASHRLRDRPKCGRCKARLMPGRRIGVCYTNPIEGVLRSDLNSSWNDEDLLWQNLADHVALQVKEKREAKDARARVVN